MMNGATAYGWSPAYAHGHDFHDFRGGPALHTPVARRSAPARGVWHGAGHAAPSVFLPSVMSLNGMSGLGGLGDTKQLVMSVPSIVGEALTAGGSNSIAVTLWSTAATPVIGAVVAGVTIGLMLLMNRKGPRQKVATTQVVDGVEPFMRDNLQGYFAGPRTVSSQAQALANFDAGWQYIVEHCAIPEMGNPGQACVNDRKQGACTWREAGACWNWFIGYRDPIANDVPNADPLIPQQTMTEIQAAIDAVVPGSVGGSGWYLLAGGLIILVAAMRS